MPRHKSNHPRDQKRDDHRPMNTTQRTRLALLRGQRRDQGRRSGFDVDLRCFVGGRREARQLRHLLDITEQRNRGESARAMQNRLPSDRVQPLRDFTSSRGWANCNGEGLDGCEADTNASDEHCGVCDNACGVDERCDQGVCVNAEPILAWLDAHKGGWCLDDLDGLVNLCGKVSYCPITLCGDLDQDPSGSPTCYDDYLHEHDRAVPFCCDPTYFREYPEGLALDVGFHYDGVSTGRLMDFGADTDKSTRLSLAVTQPGLVTVQHPPAQPLELDLSEGTHLLSVRVTSATVSVFLDGALRGVGEGGGAPLDLTIGGDTELEKKGPGFVLGSRISYWWESGQTALRYAPFFVHLRGRVQDPNTFSLEESISAGPDTLVLFDESGVSGNTWTSSAGNKIGFALHRDGSGPDPTWETDVGANCL